MWQIRQDGDSWVVLRGGDIIETCPSADAAMSALSRHLSAATATLAEASEVGLLPEVWTGEIALSENTGDGRDFTQTDWSWRDPATSRLPLMWQTTTEIGHFAAELAGYMTSLSMSGDKVTAEGRFFDSDAGRQFRDTLAGAGRWGVSVDPGAVTWEDECLEMNEEYGICEEFVTHFLTYEIIGVTGTPFPAFAGAFIELAGAPSVESNDDDDDDGEDADAEASVQRAVVAAATTLALPSLLAPPRDWFNDPGFTELTPLTITDDGRVFGHLAGDQLCHIGAQGQCMTPPPNIALSRIHTGVRRVAEGIDIPTGPLVFGNEHCMDLFAPAEAALDHYAATGHAWADVRFGKDALGFWCAGALRPGLSPESLVVLRGSTLSGDWREDPSDGQLKLIACQSVNTPGYAIPRALVASGATMPVAARQRVRVEAGRVVAALGLGMVRRPCAECSKRKVTGHGNIESVQGMELLAQLARQVDVIERRTRHMAAAERDRLARQFRS